MTTVLDGPQGEEQKAPRGPRADRADGARSPASTSPDARAQRQAQLDHPDQGRRREVKKGQTITVNYLGQVYDAKKPFDESYSGEPASFPIGVGQVIKGWDETPGRRDGRLPGDPGDPAGRRLRQEGNEDAGIKGTDTLYFVVDILGCEPDPIGQESAGMAAATGRRASG